MSARIMVAAAFLIAGAGFARTQSNPAALPARDAHNGLLVAADPYRDAERCKARFGKKNPFDAGILAIEVFFRNDNDKAIRVELESIRLLLRPTGADRQRLAPLPVEEVADRILDKGKPDPTATRRTIPIPGRGPKKGRGKEWDELAASLRALAFEMDVLPPRSTVHGFLFFDLDRRYDWVPVARLYVPDLKFLPEKQPLLFFEVDLALARPR